MSTDCLRPCALLCKRPGAAHLDMVEDDDCDWRALVPCMADMHYACLPDLCDWAAQWRPAMTAAAAHALALTPSHLWAAVLADEASGEVVLVGTYAHLSVAKAQRTKAAKRVLGPGRFSREVGWVICRDGHSWH